jgi:glycosyltransferase involved in cell wall biosynthesis
MLTLIPNYAALRRDGQISLEASFPLLLAPLCEARIPLTLSAPLQAGERDGNYLPLTLPGVHFVSMGTVDQAAPTWRRLLNYLRLIPPIVRAVWGSSFCYIFFPGHVGLLAILTSWLLRRPYALYLRGDFHAVTPRVFAGLYHRILSRARFVICTGNGLRETLAPINRNIDAVVPMSPVLFTEEGKQPVAEARRDILTILFVGQLLREKGIFDLVEAIERISQTSAIGLELLMVGAGRDQPQLLQKIREKDLTKVVRCLGQIADPLALAAIYRRSDIFCLPSYFPEGFPRVLYEAMRFYLPIVTTPVGQIGTVIQDGHNGLLCEPRSVEALVDKLHRLIADDALRIKLGQAGRATLDPLLEQWRGETHGHQVLKWLKRTGMADMGWMR